MDYRPNDPVKKLFFIHNGTGALANADANPAGIVYSNGVADGAVTVTVTNLATGKYKAEFTIPSGYTPGDIVECTVDYQMSTIPICDSIWCEKLVQWSPTSIPAAAAGAEDGLALLDGNLRVSSNVTSIETNVITAASIAADAITEIQSGLMLASSYVSPPSVSDIRTEMDSNSTQLAAISSYTLQLITNTAAILADTGTDGVVVASGSKSGYALSATGLDSVTSGGVSVKTAIFRNAVVLWGNTTGTGGTSEVFVACGITMTSTNTGAGTDRTVAWS